MPIQTVTMTTGRNKDVFHGEPPRTGDDGKAERQAGNGGPAPRPPLPGMRVYSGWHLRRHLLA